MKLLQEIRKGCAWCHTIAIINLTINTAAVANCLPTKRTRCVMMNSYPGPELACAALCWPRLTSLLKHHCWPSTHLHWNQSKRYVHRWCTAITNTITNTIGCTKLFCLQWCRPLSQWTNLHINLYGNSSVQRLMLRREEGHWSGICYTVGAICCMQLTKVLAKCLSIDENDSLHLAEMQVSSVEAGNILQWSKCAEAEANWTPQSLLLPSNIITPVCVCLGVHKSLV